MIDNFALGLSHVLILLAVWRILGRPDLDDPTAPEPERNATSAKPFRNILKGRHRA